MATASGATPTSCLWRRPLPAAPRPGGGGGTRHASHSHGHVLLLGAQIHRPTPHVQHSRPHGSSPAAAFSISRRDSCCQSRAAQFCRACTTWGLSGGICGRLGSMCVVYCSRSRALAVPGALALPAPGLAGLAMVSRLPEAGRWAEAGRYRTPLELGNGYHKVFSSK